MAHRAALHIETFIIWHFSIACRRKKKKISSIWRFSKGVRRNFKKIGRIWRSLCHRFMFYICTVHAVSVHAFAFCICTTPVRSRPYPYLPRSDAFLARFCTVSSVFSARALSVFHRGFRCSSSQPQLRTCRPCPHDTCITFLIPQWLLFIHSQHPHPSTLQCPA